ncbi:MAG: LTA synthase family protein, partial [Bacteroidota bacterium]
MILRLRFLLRLFTFWTVFFALTRWVFLLYQTDQFPALTLRDWGMISLLGLRMDLSMAGYFTLVSALVIALSALIPSRITGYIIHGINLIFLVTSALIIVTDLELYQHWGYRIDATPLMYLRPEGFASAGTGTLIMLVMGWIAIVGLAAWAYRRMFMQQEAMEHPTFTATLPSLAAAALLIIPIRSGFGIAPLNTGFVYYHRTLAFPNHAGVNPVWNFMRSALYIDNLRYTEKLVPLQEAESLVASMVPAPDTTLQVIAQEKPNILLIIMEGFTSKIIEPLGGEPGLAPELSRWCEQGVLFEHLYASGDRTDKGIISILSGYPAQPRSSIIKFPSKSQSLPSWPRVMERLGYHPTFVYGGDPKFANMESYLVTSGFRRITTDADFDDSIPRSKWGFHDEHLFRRLGAECDTAQGPFFKVALTLSSHEPFDVPYGNPPAGSSDETLFLNSCKYSDRELGKFLDAAKQSDWWASTLVIITADHGHAYPGKREVMDRERFRIPMLWTGGAITTKLKIAKTGSQTDIVNTLLNQFDTYDPAFRFSKDLLAPATPGFAVYAYNNGFGYQSDRGGFIYDLDFRKYLKSAGADDHQEQQGKAWM